MSIPEARSAVKSITLTSVVFLTSPEQVPIVRIIRRRCHKANDMRRHIDKMTIVSLFATGLGW